MGRSTSVFWSLGLRRGRPRQAPRHGTWGQVRAWFSRLRVHGVGVIGRSTGIEQLGWLFLCPPAPRRLLAKIMTHLGQAGRRSDKASGALERSGRSSGAPSVCVVEAFFGFVSIYVQYTVLGWSDRQCQAPGDAEEKNLGIYEVYTGAILVWLAQHIDRKTGSPEEHFVGG